MITAKGGPPDDFSLEQRRAEHALMCENEEKAGRPAMGHPADNNDNMVLSVTSYDAGVPQMSEITRQPEPSLHTLSGVYPVHLQEPARRRQTSW